MSYDSIPDDARGDALDLVEGFAELLGRPVALGDVASVVVDLIRTDMLFVEDMDDFEKGVAFIELQVAVEQDPLSVIAHTISTSAVMKGPAWTLYNGARILVALQAEG